MTARPDAPNAPSPALLGDAAYPASHVSHAGATYWLGRSGAGGGKRLVAVTQDESVLDGFTGSGETVDGQIRFVADTTADNALALRAALPWLTPSRLGLHTSAGFGDR